MGKKASGQPVDEVVSQALVKVATSDVPLLLTHKTEPAVFPSATAGGAKAAIPVLRDEAAPLIGFVGSGKTATVRLTPAGFQRIAAQLPEEKVGPAAKAVATELPAGERVAFLNEIVSRTPAAAAELLPLYEAAVAAEKAEAEARIAAAAKRRERDEAVRQALARWMELTERQRQQRVEALQRELAAEGVKPAAPPAPPPTPPNEPPRVVGLKPESREDITFRRDVAGRLVATWLESLRLNKPEGRLFLETAMGNVGGLRQVGEEGERVSFNGQYHEADVAVPTGAPVRVVRPGWVLEEEDGGEHRLVTARVSP
jgi:hypothetical protein